MSISSMLGVTTLLMSSIFIIDGTLSCNGPYQAWPSHRGRTTALLIFPRASVNTVLLGIRDMRHSCVNTMFHYYLVLGGW